MRGFWLLVVSGVNRIHSLRQMLSSSPPGADHVKGLSLDKVGVEVASRRRIVISDTVVQHERARHQAHWRRYFRTCSSTRRRKRISPQLSPFDPRQHELHHNTAPSVGVHGAGSGGGGVGLQNRGRRRWRSARRSPRPGLAGLLHTPLSVRPSACLGC